MDGTRRALDDGMRTQIFRPIELVWWGSGIAALAWLVVCGVAGYVAS